MLRVTKTENGAVRGLPGTDARITVFKGIPYAADTSGANRWRVPQPAENWDGVRDCFEFSPITMQSVPGKNPDAFYSKEWHVDAEVPMSEDSLTLNIWTNAKSGSENMPVLIWIFGGGLKEGYAYEMEFDGERMASRGVVVVTIAYRVNVFGNLAHPDLTAEDPEHPTNFGFLDQQAAIKWVGRNIQNFGGDPKNITIAGQSAGGVSVYCQMCAPSSKGLFQKAIAQSSTGGSVISAYPKSTFGRSKTLKEAEEMGVKFLEEVLGVKTIEEARKLDAFYIRDKLDASGMNITGNVMDGKFLTMQPYEYMFSGEVAKMPLMIGDTGDEFISGAKGSTMEEVEAWADEFYGPYAKERLAMWKAEGGDDVEAVKKASLLNTNQVSTAFAAQEYASQGNPVYRYIFDPEIPGDEAGSFHSSELWFTFETLMKCWRPFDGHHYDLSRKMCNYWTNFAKYGDPNGLDADGTPMPTWEKYSAENPRVMQFYDDISMGAGTPKEADQTLIDMNRNYYRNAK